MGHSVVRPRLVGVNKASCGYDGIGLFVLHIGFSPGSILTEAARIISSSSESRLNARFDRLHTWSIQHSWSFIGMLLILLCRQGQELRLQETPFPRKSLWNSCCWPSGMGIIPWTEKIRLLHLKSSSLYKLLGSPVTCPLSPKPNVGPVWLLGELNWEVHYVLSNLVGNVVHMLPTGTNVVQF